MLRRSFALLLAGLLAAPLALVEASWAESPPAPKPTPPAPAVAAPSAPIHNTIRWATASELNNFGFDVYRGLSEEGPFERVTPKPVAGAGTSDETNTYAFIDDTIEAGVVYHYYVEEISLSGSRKKISPIFAAPAKGLGDPSPEKSTTEEPGSDEPEDKAATREPDSPAVEGAPEPKVVNSAVNAKRFKIRVAETAVYRVDFASLTQAGFPAPPQPSNKLSLSAHGEPVPIHVVDGGDSAFGPGDWFEFVGHGPGQSDQLDNLLTENVYVLDTRSSGGARMREVKSLSLDAKPLPQAMIRSKVHREQDELLPRFSGGGEDEEGTQWFWTKLTHIDDGPYDVELDLADLAPSAGENVTLRIALRGWSKQSRKASPPIPDHRIEVSMGRKVLGSSEWDGTEPHTLELTNLRASTFRGGKVTLSFRVPPRIPEGESDPIIDVVMLDSVALDFQRSPTLRGAQSLFSVHAEGPARVQLGSFANTVTAYTDDGTRSVHTLPGELDDAGNPIHPLARLSRGFKTEAGNHQWIAVQEGRLRRPLSIQPDKPSQLRSSSNQADYLMVTHASLRDAVTPLASYHREQGLVVELVDVEDVFDEFSHGLPLASGLKSFFTHAWQEWQEPKPRFVLLVGDASWDTKHDDVDVNRYDDLYFNGRTEFGRIPARAYEVGSHRNDRNLIPTGSYRSGAGHAASDNWLVNVDGDDFLPEMAIGRFPVVTPEDVTAIVNKTLQYARSAPEGDWRKNILWITNEQQYIQKTTDRLSESSSEAGYQPTKIFPSPDEKDNAEHQGRIREAFDDGPLLVHFHGHGGRFIWRTGPPDLRKNHDLFTLEDLDALEPNDKLPLVLSMSCYSAPFDHPSADSIGEKLLRMDGKGAVAVLGASWRNSPTPQFSTALLEELTKPGTVGEAILRVKRRVQQRTLVEQYNLLGDPAIKLALPALPAVVVPEPAPAPNQAQRMEAMRKRREERLAEQAKAKAQEAKAAPEEGAEDGGAPEEEVPVEEAPQASKPLPEDGAQAKQDEQSKQSEQSEQSEQGGQKDEPKDEPSPQIPAAPQAPTPSSPET